MPFSEVQKLLSISNVKISVKVKSKTKAIRRFKERFGYTKESPSFFVCRICKLVFIVYYSGHINVTGIRSHDEINQVLNFLLAVPGIKRIESYQIDNITSSGQLSKRVFKSQGVPFAQYLHNDFFVKYFDAVKYTPQHFPGAFLRIEALGTVVLFSSGKFNIVGCSTPEGILLILYSFIKCVRRVFNKNYHVQRF